MDWISHPEAWIGLVTLTLLEIVLGIDNIIFITILAARLPAAQQSLARRLGLAVALVGRVLLLLSLSWVVRLTAPLFAVAGNEVSGRDLVLLFGGLFLLAKATHEIHSKIEGAGGHEVGAAKITLASVLIQICLLDVVFSLDSVITAVGMVQEVSIMVMAVILAIGVMILAADAVAGFVNRHPTVQMLALSFLLLIGILLVAESFDKHIPKGYIYFAMAFSVFVEMLNLRLRAGAAALHGAAAATRRE